ncbi:LOW QUALITY PROTEIN: roundabout homolog 4 [Apus apus]|uniref:LOW QUALITY PROTEIN: roundabout homolog 4 n=1 Tax=Apus apus TaxID=8895 RepID=UPI0021F82509|nr:LOW QUALITY PROTEIN: roundabout homolog 4 [Apus apus]
MAGNWAMVLGVGLCLTALHWGAECGPPQPAAALQDNFRLQPGDLVATAGQTLELDCVPPLGHPEPRVTWKKDGVTLDLAGERYTVTEGKLRVAVVRRSDSGLYVCVAANAAGQRESRGARVAVLEKPTIVQHPSDTVAVSGSTVDLSCSAQGDPAPHVQWHKERGDLPQGRHEVDQEHTLHLYAVTTADTGTYVCTAQSQLGTATATARLRVQERLPTGRRDPAPQDLLAVRLHLENGTVLPTAAVWLRWQMVTAVPVPEGYMVLYRPLPASTWVQHDAGKELSTIIPNLRRGHQYEFKVRSYGGGTQGLDSNTRNLWIPEKVPSAAPQHITLGLAEKGNGTVVVSWEPPPPDAHNGIIQGYKVWSLGESWQHPTNRTVDGGTHHLEAPLPTSGAEFCVQVAAFNSAGLGVPSNATCSLLGQPAGSSGVVQVLRQPAVIAATSSLLWVALVALLLLLCQRRTRDNATHHGLVASDSQWLGGPWKPGCAPRNLSSSSSLSSRLLGSEGKDLHPSSLSLERPGLAPPTPPTRSSCHGGHLAPLGDTGCVTGGHPGVCTSPSTPTLAPWECGRKRELYPVHSTPVLLGGPGQVPVTRRGGEWDTDLRLVAGWSQPRGHNGDTGGGPWQLPAFSSPKAQQGSVSLASPVTCPQPPHVWHLPVTRSPATVCHRDMSLVTGCPKDISLVTRHPKDMSLVTGHSKKVSLVTGIPRDMSPVTRYPKDISSVTGIPRNTPPAIQCPRDRSLVTESPRDLSPDTRHQKDTISATRHPEDMSPVTRNPEQMSPVPRHHRDMSLVTRHPKMYPVPGHHRDTFLGSRYPKDVSPATRHSTDPPLVSKLQKGVSLATRHPDDTSPVSGHPRDTSPITRLPKEKFPTTGHCRDKFLTTSRYPEDMSLVARYPKDTSPVTRHPEEMSPVSGHCKDTFLGSRDMSLAPRYAEDTRTRSWWDSSLLPGHLSPSLSDGVLTPQQVAEDLEVDEPVICPRSAPSPWATTLVAKVPAVSPCSPPVPRSFSPPHTYGYIYGPAASELGEGEEEEEEEEEQRGIRGSPGGSLLNGWGSISEDNLASARCSLVSSCDGSFLLDASFARALAVAVDGLCFSLEDTDGSYGGPSPPLSPLERIFSPDVPIPTWDWGTVLAGQPQGGCMTGSSSPWTRAGDELRTGGTRAWRSPGCGTRQGQSPLSSAKLWLY